MWRQEQPSPVRRGLPAPWMNASNRRPAPTFRMVAPRRPPGARRRGADHLQRHGQRPLHPTATERSPHAVRGRNDDAPAPPAVAPPDENVSPVSRTGAAHVIRGITTIRRTFSVRPLPDLGFQNSWSAGRLRKLRISPYRSHWSVCGASDLDARPNRSDHRLGSQAAVTPSSKEGLQGHGFQRIRRLVPSAGLYSLRHRAFRPAATEMCRPPGSPGLARYWASGP